MSHSYACLLYLINNSRSKHTPVFHAIHFVHNMNRFIFSRSLVPLLFWYPRNVYWDLQRYGNLFCWSATFLRHHSENFGCLCVRLLSRFILFDTIIINLLDWQLFCFIYIAYKWLYQSPSEHFRRLFSCITTISLSIWKILMGHCHPLFSGWYTRTEILRKSSNTLPLSHSVKVPWCASTWTQLFDLHAPLGILHYRVINLSASKLQRYRRCTRRSKHGSECQERWKKIHPNPLPR